MLMGQWEILWGVCWDLKRAQIGPIRYHVRECGLVQWVLANIWLQLSLNLTKLVLPKIIYHRS